MRPLRHGGWRERTSLLALGALEGREADQARAEAERLSGRPGRAHELNVLVWNRDDRQLVRVSVPMWIVRKAKRHVDWDDDAFDGDRRARDHVREALRHVRLEDLETAGLGILAEVEEDGGDQVLVWLR